MRLHLEALEDRTLLSSISGTVFNDLNGDGVLQSGEPGLPGWEVDLQGPTTNQAVLTDANGNFTFNNLNPGTFTIQEVLEPNWHLTTTPPTYTVTIPSGGGDVSGLVFGNFQFVRISGTVFNDLNGDGSQESGEPGLQRWTVDLIKGQSVVKRQTDSSGNFIFAGVGPGSYTIQEEVQSGWVQTSLPTTYSVTTSSGVDVGGAVFGNSQNLNADLAVTKTGPAETIAGDPANLTYTITLTNNGPSDAQNVSLSDALPAGETLVSQTQTSGPVFTLGGIDNTINDTLGTLAAGASASFTVTAHVSPNVLEGTVLSNTATVSTNTTDPDLTNNSSTASTLVHAHADLTVTKTGPTDTIAGDPANLAYTITVVNNGLSDAQAVALSDALPAGETLVSQSQTSGPTFALGGSEYTISDTIATLPAGASASFTVTAHVSPSVLEGTVLSNTATISSTTTDPDLTNNNSTASTLVHAYADLTVTKTGPTDTIAGDPANLTYTITLTNNGPSDAQAVTLSDALPPGETLVSQSQTSGPTFALGGSEYTISDTIATLPAGASASFTVVAHVSPSVLEGTVLGNTATISSGTTDPDSTNNSSTANTLVHAQADLAVTKTGPAETIAGDPAGLTYTVTVVNNGPSDSQAVAFNDALPAGETLISQTQSSGPTFALGGSGNAINDTIATLAAGASASFTITAHVSPSVLEGTVLSNTATISSSTSDPDSTNNSSTASTLVHANADLTVTKTGPAETIAGDPANLTYTITVVNNGLGDAQSVALSDALPAGETLVSQTQTSGPVFALGSSGSTINDTLGTLAAGASASFTVMARVSPSVPEGTVLSNTATINSSTTDPDSTNNSSTASTLVHSLTHTTTTILTSSANPSVLAQPVTFTATVSSAVGGMPTGTVDFFDVTTNADLGTITLSDGAAELTISSLAVGDHLIQANYSGDSIFQPSVGLITQSVQYHFSGYLAPLNKKLVFAIDRTVPIKFQLTDFNGNFITSLSAITSLQVSGPSGIISLTPSLRNDSSHVMANWKTKGLLAGTYTISLSLADGTTKTLNVRLTTNGKGGVTQTAAGADGGDNSGLADTLLAGDLNVYINDPNGYFTADELARIQDTINGLNALLAPYGIAINEVGDSSSANLVLDIGTTSACGGAADGVLGCFNGPAGEITILQGWNWYAGADPTKINGAQYDFQSTLTHEFGHALGLGGATDLNSPMFETLAMGQAHRTMTVADLNLLEPPEGPDPERASLSPWAGIYPVALSISGEENLTSIPQQGHSPAAEHTLGAPLADSLSVSEFGARANLLNDDTSSFNREAPPTVDEQDEFWSTFAGSTVLARITDLMDHFGR